MNNDGRMNDIYRRLPPRDIPWNTEEPAGPLIELIDRDLIKPCRAIDLGCGTGTNTCYLASRGFDATGVDISPEAVRLAAEKAANRGLKCNFISADLLDELPEIDGKFDFAVDWEVLHHIFPSDREKYLNNVSRILNSGALYLSLCFSEEDPVFGGSGKFRKTSLGTVLYLSSEKELRELFENRFLVLELKTITVPGKISPHRAVYVLMKKE